MSNDITGYFGGKAMHFERIIIVLLLRYRFISIIFYNTLNCQLPVAWALLLTENATISELDYVQNICLTDVGLF